MKNQQQTSKSRTLLECAALCVLLAPVAVAQQDSPSVVEQRAFLNKYCVTCHSDKLRVAGLSLESVHLSDVTQSGETLEKVVRQLGSGSMPPAPAPKPGKAAAEAFLTSLKTS